MNTVAQSKVFFFYDSVSFSFSNRTKLKLFIEHLFKKEGSKLSSINYVFCSDKKLLEINRQFLNHDYYTDIITFNISDNTKEIAGEVYISIDRVKDNAKTLGNTFSSELHRVIFHGALHLCGYKDKTNKEIEGMRAAEDRYLQAYFNA